MSRGRRKRTKKQCAPRYPWEYYGLGDKGHRRKLEEMCRSGRYGQEAGEAAYQTCPEIAGYLIRSVTQRKSYDMLEFDPELGRICVGRTDFYGYRRRFYYLFDLKLKEECSA